MIYFDNAATSFPKSQKALDAITYAATHFTSPSRGSYPPSLESSKIIFKTRQKVCNFVHCKDGICVFTPGTTVGLNMIIQGLFKSGDHLITTIIEHNSILRPLYSLQEKGVLVDYAKCNNQGIVPIENIKNLKKNNTKAILISLVSNVLGSLQEIKTISNYAHRHNLLVIVDAAQAIGNMEVSMDEMGIDILVFGGHKGLATPIGIGAIVMNRPYEIEPLFSGGSGFHSFEKQQPSALPERLEAGSQPIELIYALSVTIDQQNNDKYYYIKSLCSYFINQVEKINGISILGANHIGIVTIDCNGFSSEEISNYLYTKKGICVRSGIHCAPLVHQFFKSETRGLVRFSFNAYNSKEQINEAIAILKELMIK